MDRKIYKDLILWKQKSDRKPLILQGARQVGKTYIVNYFAGKEYANSVYLNFEKDKGLVEFFADLTPEKIIKKISVYKRREIIPGHTLLIFDEIQACPEAITSLKYFCEDAPEYHVVALGSLLGVSVNRGNSSFPVGKVEFMTLYPLDFEEYLLARGEEELVKMIYESFSSNSALESVFHERALDYYKEYLFVGGMPEAVEEYNKNGNPDLVRIIQQSILEAYHNDMGKYNKRSEIPKTKLIYKSISTQLAKENKKFKYKDVKQGGRASEFESAIEWLCLAGIARQNYRLEQIMLPMDAYRSLSDFKFYMSDVGLCGASQDIDYEDIVYENPMLDNFKGGLAENYVYCQLLANGLPAYYWTSGSQAEVDFISRIGGSIIPIEVKAKINNRSRSLQSYVGRYSPDYSIRISAKNFGFENGIKSVPLYAVFCIKKQ
ncbi:MAG: ATP-binding protein [Clostridia bacterium]|nr:ATP-binding protein [Clostridia bacterium]